MDSIHSYHSIKCTILRKYLDAALLESYVSSLEIGHASVCGKTSHATQRHHRSRRLVVTRNRGALFAAVHFLRDSSLSSCGCGIWQAGQGPAADEAGDVYEIGVLRGQCLDRRIATPERLVSEITAWERQRNATRAQVKNGPRLPRASQHQSPPDERVIILVQRY